MRVNLVDRRGEIRREWLVAVESLHRCYAGGVVDIEMRRHGLAGARGFLEFQHRRERHREAPMRGVFLIQRREIHPPADAHQRRAHARPRHPRAGGALPHIAGRHDLVKPLRAKPRLLREWLPQHDMEWRSAIIREVDAPLPWRQPVQAHRERRRGIIVQRQRARAIPRRPGFISRQHIQPRCRRGIMRPLCLVQIPLRQPQPLCGSRGIPGIPARHAAAGEEHESARREHGASECQRDERSARVCFQSHPSAAE